MNQWKGMPAAEIKVVPRGNNLWCVMLEDHISGQQTFDNQSWGQVLWRLDVFNSLHDDYQPNVPIKEVKR